jgi:ribosomal RNA-processing protein 1
MHDSKNAVSVQNLIAEIAGLLKVVAAKDTDISRSGGQAGVWLDTWTTAFWETISREWVSIDQWRMNKVLLLVRFFLRETFSLLFAAVSVDESQSGFTSNESVTRQVQVLETWPLSPRERKVPDGLRLHVLDVWSDELVGQLKAAQGGQDSTMESGEDEAKGALTDAAKLMMAPLEKISKEALSKGVKIRAKEALKSFQEGI